MALDLAAEERFAVTVADIDEAALERLRTRQPKIELIRADLSDPSKVTELAARHDIALNAVPGFMGYATLAAIVRGSENAYRGFVREGHQALEHQGGMPA